MPPFEEDLSSLKSNILTQQLGTDAKLLSLDNKLEQSSSCGTNSDKLNSFNEKFNLDKTSLYLLIKSSYHSQDSVGTLDNQKELAVKTCLKDELKMQKLQTIENALWRIVPQLLVEKCVEDILRKPQVINDVKNTLARYLMCAGRDDDLSQFNSSDLVEFYQKSLVMQDYTSNGDNNDRSKGRISGVDHDGNKDGCEFTSVKETFSRQLIEVVDVDNRNEDSPSKGLWEKSLGIGRQSKVENMLKFTSSYSEVTKSPDVPAISSIKDADIGSLEESGEEKQDLEKSEKNDDHSELTETSLCQSETAIFDEEIQHLSEIEAAEYHVFNMSEFVPLSCLSQVVVTSLQEESCSSDEIGFTLENQHCFSSLLESENRFSLIDSDHKDLSFQCNIITSRQTNLLSTDVSYNTGCHYFKLQEPVFRSTEKRSNLTDVLNSTNDNMNMASWKELQNKVVIFKDGFSKVSMPTASEEWLISLSRRGELFPNSWAKNVQAARKLIHSPDWIQRQNKRHMTGEKLKKKADRKNKAETQDRSCCHKGRKNTKGKVKNSDGILVKTIIGGKHKSSNSSKAGKKLGNRCRNVECRNATRDTQNREVRSLRNNFCKPQKKIYNCDTNRLNMDEIQSEGGGKKYKGGKQTNRGESQNAYIAEDTQKNRSAGYNKFRTEDKQKSKVDNQAKKILEDKQKKRVGSQDKCTIEDKDKTRGKNQNDRGDRQYNVNNTENRQRNRGDGHSDRNTNENRQRSRADGHSDRNTNENRQKNREDYHSDTNNTENRQRNRGDGHSDTNNTENRQKNRSDVRGDRSNDENKQRDRGDNHSNRTNSNNSNRTDSSGNNRNNTNNKQDRSSKSYGENDSGNNGGNKGAGGNGPGNKVYDEKNAHVTVDFIATGQSFDSKAHIQGGSREDKGGNIRDTGGSYGKSSSSIRDKGGSNLGSAGLRPGALANRVNQSPSLPPPVLDPEHRAQRMERTLTYMSPDSLQSLVAAGIEQNLDQPASDNIDDVIDGQAFQDKVVTQHAAMSMDQLCDIIGNATHSLPSDSEYYQMLNQCLTPLVHDITLATSDVGQSMVLSSCAVCLVLSQLLTHLAESFQDGCLPSCEQCQQIFNVLIQHCLLCLKSGRHRSRLTPSDLCYKICKYARWDSGKLNDTGNKKLKSKVQKYCDKVLGSVGGLIDSMVENSPQGIGEMGLPHLMSDIPSSDMSPVTRSLKGNIVTTETGESPQEATASSSPASSYISFGGQTASPSSLLQELGSETLPGNGAESSPSLASHGPGNPPLVGGFAPAAMPHVSHSPLTRKPSLQQAKSLANLPPIDEENQIETSPNSIADDAAMYKYIKDKFGYSQMTDDPYSTQKTYGEAAVYGSLPLTRFHDVEQFLSVSGQPMGMPGIGEVVYGRISQLRKVARYWDQKREECERTQTCPYQHREEGVILDDQKANFNILRNRYQKHQQWERVSHLGNGMSGKCHLAIDLKTNFQFCCKKIHLLRYAEEELTIWSDIHNPYVVRLYGAIRHGVKVYIFSEFINGGSLAACIEEQKRLGRRLSHWSAINYFQQLLKILAFLQSKNILHEDIKADNILLRQDSTFLALTDFGTSRRLQDPKELKNKSPMGSPTHWSPEKACMEGHGFPSDLWAAVCVLVHMLSGDPPWVKRYLQKAAILNFVIYSRSPPMEDVPHHVQVVVKDLIQQGFVRDALNRPSASELLKHQAFKILGEGTPETFFSMLVSMAPPLPGTLPLAAGASIREQVAGQISSAGATVLYREEIPVKTCQESDSRSDHRNNTSLLSSQEFQGVTDNSADRPQKSADTQEFKLPSLSEKQTGSFNNEFKKDLGLDARIQGTGGPVDQQLPNFQNLLQPDDSPDTQSIKYFFTDTYNSEAFNMPKFSILQEYKPQNRPDQLPHLSIFDRSPDPASNFALSPAAAIFPQASAAGERNEIPSALDASVDHTLQLLIHHASMSPATFTISSESEECTSADLFESDLKFVQSDLTLIENSPTLQTSQLRNPPNMEGNDNINFRQTESKSQVSPDSLPDDQGATRSHSGGSTSSLQMRKPNNLTLNVTGSPPPPPPPTGLMHSQSEVLKTKAPTGENAEIKRSQTFSHISAAALSQATNSTQQGALPPRKTSTTSVPSTASSNHSQFSYHGSSVREEQERMLQEFEEMTDMMTGFENRNTDAPSPDIQMGEVKEDEEKAFKESFYQTILAQADPGKSAGNNLKFHNESSTYLFTLLFEEFPFYWKNFIGTVRQKISQYGYHHFSIRQMDDNPVDFNCSLRVSEVKVFGMPEKSVHCWCNKCQPMY